MNQLGDMGNKEKEITTRLPHKEEGRNEGRKEKAVSLLHGNASPLQHMHNN
jgi:hypothetical protein